MKKVIYSTVAIIMMAGAVAFADVHVSGKSKAGCTCVKCSCPDAPNCVCSK